MKIGTKISWFYSTVTFGIAFLIIIIFYVFTSRYINRLFDVNLTEKAYLVAEKHWKKDELDSISYDLVLKKYKTLLPEAYEVLLNKKDTKATNDTLRKYLSPLLIQTVYEGGPVTFKYGNKRGVAIYYTDNQGNFFVIILAHNTYGSSIKQHLLLLSGLLLLLAILISFVMGRVYAKNLLAPLKMILSKLRNIRGNNLNVRLEESGNKDELDELKCTLNEMLDRINEAFKSEKSFVNAASHELNNPLTAIQGECEISLMKERSPKEYIESLQHIFMESRRLSQLTKQLLFLSHDDGDLLNQEISSVQVSDMLREFAQDNKRIVFTDYTSGNVSISVNTYLINVALQNFISNACKYSKDNVDVRLKVSNGYPLIEIEDYGIGIPKEEISQIYQSFYRASNTHEFKGNGIGLTLSLKILKIYGVHVSVDSEENVHTKFSIIFES
jgi:two-component system, OmpR family, sensor histidine kinase ArlS